MAKYPKPKRVVEEPKAAVKHYWHAAIHGAAKHRDTLVTVALVAAIAVLLGVIWNHYAEAREADAWEAVGASSTREELEQAVARYGGTPGEILKLKLAQGYIRGEEPDKAVEVAKGVTRQDEAWLSEAGQYTLARAQEAAGEFDDARNTYETLAAGTDFWATKAKGELVGVGERATAYERLKALKDTAAAEAAEKVKAAVAMESTAAAATQAAGEALQETKQAEEIAPATGSTGAQATSPAISSTENQ